ncbi:MAG: TIGR01777 family oxidoreductase [Proteobacteria bacterium]|nr:TIGR01777 family oxidoreductase [Pseudomonadota bacterium]
MKKIILAGGSGYIGQAFYKKFQKKYNIKILSRFPLNKEEYIGSLESCDVLINLAGASIFPMRWTPKRKKIILDSRVKYSSKLLQNLDKFNVQHYLQASATSFYPFSRSEIFTEDSVKQYDSNFSLQLVQEWESQINKSPIKCNSLLRIGVVAGPRSKFLAPLTLLYNFFLGGRIGNGMQWVSWIHIYDLIQAIDFIIENKLQGPVNLTAPNVITNKQMSEMLASVLQRPNIFHMPKWFYQMVFGEASELLTKGHQVYPKTLVDKGFQFKFDEFRAALEDSI